MCDALKTRLPPCLVSVSYKSRYYVVEELALSAVWEITFREMKDLRQNAPDPFIIQGPGMPSINQLLSFLRIPQLQHLLLFSAAQNAPGVHAVNTVVVYFS